MGGDQFRAGGLQIQTAPLPHFVDAAEAAGCIVALRKGESLAMRIGRLVGSAVIVAFLAAPFLRAQVEPPQPPPTVGKSRGEPPPPTIQDGWHRILPGMAEVPKNPAPAPRHDIGGTWDPGPTQGIQAGVRPDDGIPEDQPPYTPLGLEKLNENKPSAGFRSVLPGDTNDPIDKGDPQGMPREDLYELRVTQIVQFPEKVFVLYTNGRVWRVIWTDGRDFPKDMEQRWFGYSIGRWVNDTTLVVETRGVDERTWADRAGRPHSADMVVKEWFHRVNQNRLELSVQIDDSKMYTKPWMALYKLPFDLRSPDYDVREMIFAPSDFGEYNRLLANPVSDSGK